MLSIIMKTTSVVKFSLFYRQKSHTRHCIHKLPFVCFFKGTYTSFDKNSTTFSVVAVKLSNQICNDVLRRNFSHNISEIKTNVDVTHEKTDLWSLDSLVSTRLRDTNEWNKLTRYRNLLLFSFFETSSLCELISIDNSRKHLEEANLCHLYVNNCVLPPSLKIIPSQKVNHGAKDTTTGISQFNVVLGVGGRYFCKSKISRSSNVQNIKTTKFCHFRSLMS